MYQSDLEEHLPFLFSPETLINELNVSGKIIFQHVNETLMHQQRYQDIYTR